MTRGFTLVEVVVVLVILAIVVGATAPALANIGSEDPSTAATRELLSLLRDTRRGAIDLGTSVSIVVDPRTGRYWVTPDEATQPTHAGSMPEGVRASLIPTVERATFVFDPRGVARGDSLVLRTANGSVTIDVNRWTGAPRVR